MHHEDGVTRVIPKPSYKGMKGGAVEFVHEGEHKSVTLPTRLLGADVTSLAAAIAKWAA